MHTVAGIAQAYRTSAIGEAAYPCGGHLEYKTLSQTLHLSVGINIVSMALLRFPSDPLMFS